MLLLFIYSFAIAIHLLIHGYQFPYLIHRQKEGGGYWCGRFDGFGAGVEMHDFGLAYLVVGDGGLGIGGGDSFDAFCHSTISFYLPSFAFAAMLFPGAKFEAERAFGITWEFTSSLQRG